MHYEDKKTGSKFEAVSGVPKENTVEAFEELFAANKAAEEGELAALPLTKSQYGFDRTLSFCAADMYEYALQAIEADRASRQVANKAEVEPVAWIRDNPAMIYNDGKELSLRQRGGNEGDEGWKPLVYAAPPATTGASTAPTDEELLSVMDPPRAALKAEDWDPVTKRPKVKSFGASTVLTDERIDALWEEAFRHESFKRGFARAIEREVEAQAGQVAVPGWISVDDRLPKDYERVLVLKDCGDGSLHSYAVGFVDRQSKDCWFADGYRGSLAYVGYRVTHWMPLPPSPAKESK